MEAKINIEEILKDKPQGTKLYDWLYNRDVELDTISTTDTETVVWCTNETDNNTLLAIVVIPEFGTVRGCPDGLQILLPSKSMRDWSKFAWKKGDVLVSNDGKREVLFKTWENDSYTKFVGFHCLITNDNEEVEYDNGTTVFNTNDFKGTEAEDAAQTYINTIEERLGGKLNLETLKIEKTQPYFKDGDILSVPSTALPKNHIFIFSKFNKYKDFEHHVALTASGKITTPTSHGAWCRKDSGVKYATEEEKQQLFDALAKVGKAWDDEKKQIVDLKPKWTPKPFDRVLVRNTDTEEWFPGFFKKFDSTWNNPYHIMNRRSMTDFAFKQCIPYEGNEHLLGTTNNMDD